MKRIAVILLLLIYTASVYGITIDKFYCCGKLASVSLSASSASKSDCKATSGSDCCKTVKANFKVKDNHVSAKTDLTLKNSFAVVIPVFSIPALAERITLKEVNGYNSQAPPVQRDPLYILYSNYRI
ncbi:HYC_CC_PP family protein [Mucilaginibacter lappiensis]|uniref:Uncharacterized protein n=1 Tax=Mucilaginibacter lappiensis TaxID=354630 RepID=A0A1N7BZK8_9SPHI|nr:hypothetical protein [Mucilaginibacter lappiensis]MBB6109961.1 hypothetical protein [Mucilaginibacter lappiensis]MBB6126675.1 hypothetical protein [Mucilaginibacter lappiensis]SIR56634.1 hypothetical protein SAMN05421821_108229 [Mucilaginibacter lappiensis]